jgi:hypothetical protein
MILPHTFREESHEYLVDGYFVLSTSSILSLNGFTSYEGIPKPVLDHASWRGIQTHKAIEYCEKAVRQGEPVNKAASAVWQQLTGPLEEIKPFFKGYLKFRHEYEFEPIGELERGIVYLHDETAVGCTIDFRGKLHGKGFQGKTMIGDCKTTAKQSGMAKKQKALAWRLQTQSYLEASHFDEEWLKEASPDSIGRFIVNPDKEGNYTFYDFSGMDDEIFWDSSVRLAALKLSNGHKLEAR